MKALAWQPGDPADPSLTGAIITHSVRTADGKKFLLRKGTVLDAAGLDKLKEAATEVHLVIPEPGDLSETEAGTRLARAVSGPGVRIKGFIGNQYRLIAEHRGLFRVDREALRRINAVEGLTVFTRFDEQPVEQDDMVAATKCTPFVIAEQSVREVERVAAEQPVLRVLPYQPHRVGVLLLEEVPIPARERFSDVLTAKLKYFGSELGEIIETAQSEPEIVDGLQRLLDDGHDVVMVAGASSLDPLEPLFPSLRAIGARVVKHGAPAHPGSVFWIARSGAIPLFGLASCEMFSHKTVLDLVLPRLFAGEPVGRREMIELGYGGLLEAGGMDWRFPAYKAE